MTFAFAVFPRFFSFNSVPVIMFILLLISCFTLLYSSFILIPLVCLISKNLQMSISTGSMVFILFLNIWKPSPFTIFPISKTISAHLTTTYLAPVLLIACTIISAYIFEDFMTLLIHFQIIHKKLWLTFASLFPGCNIRLHLDFSSSFTYWDFRWTKTNR